MSSRIIAPNKNTGDQHFATEFNENKAVTNSHADDIEALQVSGAAIPERIEKGDNFVQTALTEIIANLAGVDMLKARKISTAFQILLGDVSGGTLVSVSSDPGTESSRSVSGFVNNKVFFQAKEFAEKMEIMLGAIHIGGITWLQILENADRMILHTDNLILDKIAAQPDTGLSSKALSIDSSGKVKHGPISALASAVTLALQNGVQNADLQVELERIISLVGSAGQGLRLSPVDDIPARDNLSGLVEENRVHVKDDGDGKWAEYRVDAPGDGTGSNATWIKLMDQDGLVNSQTDSSIKVAYLNNPNTEDYSTSEKAKLTANASKVGIPATSVPGVVVNEDTAGGHTVGVKPFVKARLDSADSNDQALITALGSAVWTNDNSTILGWAFGRYHFDDDYKYEAVDGLGAIIRVSKKKAEASVGGGSEFDYEAEFAEYWTARNHNGKTLDGGGKLSSWLGVKGVGTLTPSAANMDFVDEVSHVLVNTETNFSVSGLVTGVQPFTAVKLFFLTGFTGTPTFKHSANSGQTKGKLESAGFKFQESGSSDETLPFAGLATIDADKTYLLIYQRLANNKYQAHIMNGGNLIYSTAETTMAGGLDLSNFQNVYNDDLEKVKFVGMAYSAFDLTKIESLYSRILKEFTF